MEKLDTKALYDENRIAFAEFIKEVELSTCKFDTTGTKCDAKLDDNGNRVGQLHYTINKEAGKVTVVCFKDNDNKTFFFDVTNGLFLELNSKKELQEWISDKSNNRRYQAMKLKEKKVMITDYWLELALMAKLEPDKYKESYDIWVYGKENYRVWTKAEMKRAGYDVTGYNKDTAIHDYILDTYEINHIDGDTYNCKIENLEVVKSYLNKCHSRLMSEIHYYYPKIVEEIGTDCKNNVMHRFTSNLYRIDCSMIEEYNETHGNAYETKYKDQLKEASKLKRQANKLLNQSYVSSWDKDYAAKLLSQAESLAGVKGYETKIAPYKDMSGEFRPHFTHEQMDDILEYFNIPITEVN